MDNLKTLKSVAVASLALLAIVAFALGFYPLEESARRGGIGIPLLLPVLIDLGLVLMGLGAMAARANRLTAWPMRAMAAILIIVSAFVQYFHAAAQPKVTPVDVIVAVLPPLVLWAASSAVETLLFGASVNQAILKAEQEAARVKARQDAKQTKPLLKKMAPKQTPPPTEKLAPAVSAPLEASEPKPSSTVKRKQEPKSIEGVSDEDVQRAINEVLAGANLTEVARNFGLARSTLARRVDKARAS